MQFIYNLYLKKLTRILIMQPLIAHLHDILHAFTFTLL